MSDSEIKIRITTTNDASGADQAKQSLDQVTHKTRDASGGFDRATLSVLGFKKAMGLLRGVMTGFGAMAAVQQVIRLTDALDAARAKHQAMVEAIQSDNARAGIARLKAAYDELKDAIAGASKQIAAARENTDLLLDAERRLQDATLSRREDDQIAALDPADPFRTEKEAAIRADFDRQRALRAAERGNQDAANQETRLREDIARREAAMRDRQPTIEDALVDAANASARASAARDKSVAEANRNNIWGQRGRVFWGAPRKTIEQYAGYAAEHSRDAQDAFAVAQRGMQDQEADRQAIAEARERQATIEKNRQAVAAEGNVSTTRASRAAAAADDALSAAQAKRQADIAALEQARRDQAAADESRARQEQTRATASGRAAQEDDEAWRARNALDAHLASRPSGRGNRQWHETLRALQEASDQQQTEAADAARALQAIGEATSKHISALTAAANAAAAKIRSLENRLHRDTYGDQAD